VRRKGTPLGGLVDEQKLLSQSLAQLPPCPLCFEGEESKEVWRKGMIPRGIG